MLRRGLALLLAVAALAGCWDAQQLNELALVDAVALDRVAASGKIELTADIINRSAFMRDATYPDAAHKVVTFAATGHTVLEAVRNFSLQSGQKLFWGHAAAIVIGEDLAREGLLPWLDFFVRDVEPRMRAQVFIAQGARAGDVLAVSPRTVATPGTQLVALTGVQRLSSLGIATDLRRLTQALSRAEVGAVAGRLMIVGPKPAVTALPGGLPMGPTTERQQQALRLVGAAVLSGGRLVGWLDDRAARGRRWITAEARRGALIVRCPGGGDRFASVEMFESTAKQRLAGEGDGLRVRLEVTLDARLGDQMCPEDLSTLAAQRTLSRRAAAVIRNDIKQALQVAQGLGADIFDFAGLVRRSRPEDWPRLQARWSDQVFPHLAVDIDVRVRIRRTGRGLGTISTQRQGR